MQSSNYRIPLILFLISPFAVACGGSKKQPPKGTSGGDAHIHGGTGDSDSIGGDDAAWGDTQAPGDSSYGDSDEVEVPALTSAEAFCNPSSSSFGLTCAGSGTASRLRLTFLDDQGQIIGTTQGDSLELAIDSHPYMTVDRADEQFTLKLAAPLAANLLTATNIRVEVGGSSPVYSNALEVVCTAPPTLADGDACDRYAAFGICASPSGCPALADDARCRTGAAPVLTEVFAYYQSAGRRLGAVTIGTDGDDDLWYAETTLLDGFSQPVTVLNGPVQPFLTTLDVTQGAGRFEATYGGHIPASIPANVEFAAVRLRVFDELGEPSNVMEIAVTAPPTLARGTPCRLDATTGGCESGDVCSFDDGTLSAQTLCMSPIVACPGEWYQGTEAIIELNLHSGATADSWHHDGSSSGASTRLFEASCGGGSPQVIYRFAANAAGTYQFDLVATDTIFDPLLFARSHCTHPQQTFELGCTDDLDLPLDVRDSQLIMNLSTSQEIFLIVDGKNAAGLVGPQYSSGAYALTAERTGP